MVRKQFRKKNSSAGVKALKMVKTLVKATEVKNLDTAINDPTLARAGAVFAMFPDLTQGDGDGEIVGDKVFVKRVVFNWTVSAIAASTIGNSTGYIRIIVVQTPDRNSLTLAVTDILEAADPDSLWNKDSRLKYKVLYNKVKYIKGNTAALMAGNGQSEWLMLGQKLNVGKGYIKDVQNSTANNDIHMIVLHNYEDEGLSFQANVRVSYTDS